MPKRGGRRKKRRTHVDPDAGAEALKIPRSFVVKKGKVDTSVAELVEDMRRVMAPNTAAKLKEKKGNSVKDYVSVAGPLHVTHLVMFTQTSAAVNLRVGRLPRGPTLEFKVENYSLMRHVRAALKNPVDPTIACARAPLVVLNNFGSASPKDKHVTLMAKSFENMFPPIDVSTVSVTDCKRVVLFHYHPEKDCVDVRHYNIRTGEAEMSAPMKALSVSRSAVPDLSGLADVSEFFSESVVKASAGAGAGAGAGSGSKSSVSLVEIGPRMTLTLAKVLAGCWDGEVLYHKFVTKTPKEVEDLKKRALAKAKRREAQEANVRRKQDDAEVKRSEKLKRRQEKKAAREAEGAGAGAGAGAGPGGVRVYESDGDSDVDDDRDGERDGDGADAVYAFEEESD